MGDVRVTVLGIAQDGGAPQPGCTRTCCTRLRQAGLRHAPAGIGIEGEDGSLHLIDISRELGTWLEVWGQSRFDSVSLTHGHLGHIDGLGLLGCEVMNAQNVKIHGSASMLAFLEKQTLTSDLVDRAHIVLSKQDARFAPSPECGFELEMVRVPHRDEHTDTHAYVVRGPNSSILYLPDHDFWSATLDLNGCESIRAWLKQLQVDVALIDGTFYDDAELPGERLKSVPHPRVSETLERLIEKQSGDPDIRFIHLNHSNPLLDQRSDAYTRLTTLGWSVSEPGEVHLL